MAFKVRISLANKCQLLFGGAVLLILTAALSVVWLRMDTLVSEGQKEAARRLANAWLSDMIQLGFDREWPDALDADRLDQGLTMALVRKDEFELAAQRDRFLSRSIKLFQSRNDESELFRPAEDDRGQRYYRYARAVRKSDVERLRSAAGFGPAPTLPYAPNVEASAIANPLEMVLLVQLRADQAEHQLLLNRVSIVAAGLLAGLLAIGVFWFVTMRIILQPVRVLRDTAEKVSGGDLNIRSEIHTGDEFEQLATMFNQMLANLKSNQDQLRGINKSLDLKLGELAASNVLLYEANKVKGEFLANVSHELRTPLNSIIGFAEILAEGLEQQIAANPGGVPDANQEKRRRYLSNIILSSRRLLDLINDLLDLAKIEAGRMELRVGTMSVTDAVEGLINLMRPQAEKRQIELRCKVSPDVPLVHTDASKFQQVLFNFLSNAVKFTPAGGSVNVYAALSAPSHGPGSTGDHLPKLRVSVTDNGPGIPPDKHETIFEKFTQLDATVTKEHAGTGLGLAISKDLARLLNGRIELDSDVGRGATFTLVIPLSLEPRTAPLMPDLATAR